jgi:hypothetical protein
MRIIDKAGAFFRRWNPRSGADINDTILAATAILANGKIYTLNTKHYPMPGLAIQRAWS